MKPQQDLESAVLGGRGQKINGATDRVRLVIHQPGAAVANDQVNGQFSVTCEGERGTAEEEENPDIVLKRVRR